MEQWKPIHGYEGSYLVSSHGQVKALFRESIQKGRWGEALVRFPERTFKISKTMAGYNYVSLCKNGICIKYLVHRLVLRAFIGESTKQCNHKDGNKDNNNIYNLEYCTASENLYHCINVLGKKRGENTKASKLKEFQVLDIRKDNRTIKEIAAHYKMTYQAIHYIKTGKNWKWLK